MYKKKVFIVGPAYPYRGGQALVEAYLYHTLIQLGYDANTISYKLLYPSLLFPGTTQYDASSFIPFEHQNNIYRLINSINPLTWIKTFRVIKKENADAVIFVWWMPFFGPALGYIAYQIRKRMKNTRVFFLVENYISHESRWFDKFITKRTLKHANFFISESTHITQQLNLNFPQTEVMQTTLSVYDCYDLKKYTKETAKKELNISSNKVILFFGMIRPYKGLDRLIETFSQMTEVDATLLIVGESYENISKYERMIDAFDLRSRTRLINKYIANEDVEIYFKSADVLVLPYYSGTQSGILMMAYGFGVPVVATSVGGISELIINNKTGIVVDNNNVENLKPGIENILRSKSTSVYTDEIKKLTHNLGYVNLKTFLDKSI